jgi:hypothetical protein
MAKKNERRVDFVEPFWRKDVELPGAMPLHRRTACISACFVISGATPLWGCSADTNSGAPS